MYYMIENNCERPRLPKCNIIQRKIIGWPSSLEKKNIELKQL